MKTVNHSKNIKGGISVFGWMLAFIVIFDFLINAIFPPPDLSQGGIPAPMRLYFHYGDSVENKIRNIIGDTPDNIAPIAKPGWLQPAPEVEPKIPGKRRITAYGQSFTHHTMQQLERLYPEEFQVRLALGPAAPFNHSYAGFLRDIEAGHVPEVAVFGILASSLPGLDSLTHMTWNFEAPAPFTYPLFRAKGGELIREDPVVDSLSEYQSVLSDPSKQKEWFTQLEKNDSFYNSLLVNASVFDNSALYRMLIRAWSQTFIQSKKDYYYNPKTGFNEDSGIVDTARLMIKTINDKCESQGCEPLFILFNDQGYSDHLYQQLKDALESESIAFISSHEIAPSTDYSKFLPDGHFLKSIDATLAQKIHPLLIK